MKAERDRETGRERDSIVIGRQTSFFFAKQQNQTKIH